MGQVHSLAVARDFIRISQVAVREEVSDNDLLKATLLNRSRLASNGCWEWTKGGRAGYGLFYWKGKSEGAHRVSYQAYHGEEIPPGMVVRHKCDNPCCINPNHLLIGTVADNVADREARRRRNVRGEQIGTSKLTSADIVEIRASGLKGIELAEKFAVSGAHISRIRKGQTWAHLHSGPQGE